jgi:hypothetical protein
MAAPSAPTLVTITTEALKRAGYSSPSAALLTRAQDEWMEEIKNDVWTLAKKIKALQATNVFVITKGEGLISYPADFSSDLSMVLMDCTHYGVCQAGGGVTTAKLAADEDMGEEYPIGKKIILYLTADKTTAYESYVTAFNTTTKVATFSPAIAVTPDATYSYMVSDSHEPIKGPDHIIRLDELHNYAERGVPLKFYPVGDEDYGNFYLFPVPYRGGDVPWAIGQRYYANLITLDLASTLMATLYRRWRSLFIQGVRAKAFANKDDDRAVQADAKYQRELQRLTARELYGTDLSDMQQTASD